MKSASAVAVDAQPSTIGHPLPPAYGFCIVVHDFLSADECRGLIAEGESSGYSGAGTDYPPSYRDNDRLVVDDAKLATRLFDRLQHRIATCDGLASIRQRGAWRLIGINERIRFCRYRAGTQFRVHQDGVHHRGTDVQSRLTFMVYLNDEGFAGGDTVFFPARPEDPEGASVRFHPRTGSLIVFDHALWHAGAIVDSGTKYILRSDLLFRRTVAMRHQGPFEPAHEGYIWTLARLADGRIASAGRDASIRLWDASGAPNERLEGHTRSVLGIVETSPGELVSVSRDRSIRRWTIADRSSTVVGTMDSAVLSLARLDGGLVVTGDASGQMAWWNLQSGQSTCIQAHACWTWALSPVAGNRLVSASEDGTVKLWTRDARLAGVIHRGEHALRSLDCACLESDGALLAIGDIAGTIRLLALDSEALPVREIKAHSGAVRRVRFASPQVLYSCGEDGLVCRWDLATLRGEVVGRHGNFATDILVPGERTAISAGYDGRIRFCRS